MHTPTTQEAKKSHLAVAGLAPTTLGVQSHSVASFYTQHSSTVIAVDQRFHGVRIGIKHVKYVSSLEKKLETSTM